MHLLSELINTRWVIGSRPLSLLNLFLQADSQDKVCELFTDTEPEQTAVKIEQNKPEDRH